MTSKVNGLAAVLVVSGILAGAVGAQAANQGSGCTLAKQVYTCNRASFQKALKEAQSIAIETSPRDRISRGQLKELAVAMGKSSATEGPADMTFALSPREPDGLSIGPADKDLATLRVYAPGSNGQHGDLLWVETFRGQLDMPWPAVVHALIAQFQGKFGKA